MANTTSIRTNIAATNYDGAVYAAGLPIYAVTTVQGKTLSTVLPVPGQFVFYNPNTGLSTGTAATKSTVPLLKFGIAVSYSGSTVSADEILWYNDGTSGCGFASLAGVDGKCGTGTIWDLLFGCIVCGQTYTIEVQVYDPFTESFGEQGIGFIYSFSYTLPCGNCATGDCVEPTPNPDEVMCGLYNKIKGIHNDPNWDITLNSLPLPADHEYRFEVAKLYDGDAANYADHTTFEYCLTETDTVCKDCDQFTPIGGYTLDGSTAVVFPVATYTGANSSRSQIESAVFQLNAALGGNGTAVFLPAVGNCCTNSKIEVNTCLINFELKDHQAVNIVPCSESNPFSSQTIYAECQDCDSANTTNDFTVGLRFYSLPVEGVCDCMAGNQVLSEHFSEVEAYFKRGWNTNGGVRTIKRQFGSLPQGQGFQWQWREILSMQDGFRENFVVDNWIGKWGMPAANDRLNRTTVNCNDSYCVIGGTLRSITRTDNTGEQSRVGQDIYILIPKDHTTAKTSILLGLNNFFSGGDCGIPIVTCEVLV